MRKPYRVALIPFALSCAVSGIVNSAQVQAAPQTPKPCAVLAKGFKVGKATVQVCVKFHESTSAIKLPKDSATRKYGLLVNNYFGSSDKPSATYIDRRGKELSVSINLVPKQIRDKKSQVQFIYELQLRKGKISSAKPVLFVPIGTMVRPFTNKQFVGNVMNMNPPDGVDATAWMRWDFDKVVGTKLNGVFTNLNEQIRRSPIIEPPAPCENAINDSSQLIEWYGPILGTKSNISITWDPGMHTRMDSELVISMSTGITYMTSTPPINVLMTKIVDTRREYSWFIHGNPVGTPYNFVGTFGAKTPIRHCSNG